MVKSKKANNFDLLKKGHSIALVNIYAEYGRRIYWVGRRFIKDEFVIETLVQDSFLKLWEKRETIETPEHILNFLRFVMKRECIQFYCRPKNDFYRRMNSLDNFENYQDYMIGYDPLKDNEDLQQREKDQKSINKIKDILPLLGNERGHLIYLCLKYGFKYKDLSEVLGISITKTYNEVNIAIEDIKTIIHKDQLLELGTVPAERNVPMVLTEQQEHIFKLRCVNKSDFDAIAKQLNLSKKKVQEEFMAAYKLMKEKHQEEIEA